MTTPARVMIVDDQVLWRQGLRKLLEIEPSIDVVADAADGSAALEVLRDITVDVALVDARMPRMDGITLIATMHTKHPDVASIVLTTFDEDEYVFGAMRSGARGYLLKDASPQELVTAVHRAVGGQTVLGSPAAERLVAGLRDEPRTTAEPNHAPAEALSQREHEVAVLVGRGALNREIARQLFITEGTVKNHISSILRKTGARDRTQLALYMARNHPQ